MAGIHIVHLPIGGNTGPLVKLLLLIILSNQILVAYTQTTEKDQLCTTHSADADELPVPAIVPSPVKASDEQQLLEETTTQGDDEISPTSQNQTILNYISKISAVIYNIPYKIIPTSDSPMMAPSFCLKQLMELLISPIVYGLMMVFFSWVLVYYDSRVPGVYPPTPISPQKLKVKSGHTFHLGYAIGLINGIIVFGLTLWQQLSY